MRRSSIIALVVAAALIGGASFIPGINSVSVQSPVASTVATGNSFQQILAADQLRKGCLIPNVSAHTMLVYAVPTGGSVAAATALNSIPVVAGGSFKCDVAGSVVTNAIAVTTSTTSDPLLAWFTR